MKALDTAIAVDYLRGSEAATKLLSELLTTGEEVVASEMVRYELLIGARQETAEALEAFCAPLIWVPVDEQVARGAALLASRYRRSHRGIDDSDYVIAATALLLGAELLTRNVRHFPMFAGLAAPY